MKGDLLFRVQTSAKRHHFLRIIAAFMVVFVLVVLIKAEHVSHMTTLTWLHSFITSKLTAVWKSFVYSRMVYFYSYFIKV